MGKYNQTNSLHMGFANNFKKTLHDFFFVQHPRQIKKIPQILKEFKGQEEQVMLLLCEKYQVNPNTIPGLNPNTASNSAPAIEEEKMEKITIESNADSSEEDAKHEQEPAEAHQEETDEKK